MYNLSRRPIAFCQLHPETDKTAIIGIVGLGYVGLPLALRFAETGFHVIGFDIDSDKIKALDAGRSYTKHIPSERIERAITEKTLW